VILRNKDRFTVSFQNVKDSTLQRPIFTNDNVQSTRFDGLQMLINSYETHAANQVTIQNHATVKMKI